MHTAETVFAAAQRLQQGGTPYALVSVVRALAPTSARPGDKAIVTVDGEWHGWVGGGCAQPAVIRTVRLALADGRARLIRIAPAEQGHEKDLGDVLEFGMSCHSGGTLELFVDPVLPRAQLVVIGSSPVAQGLTQLAPRVGFAVTLVAHDADAAAFPDAMRVIASDDIAKAAPPIAPGAWVVVATQGRRDVQALRLALALQARQVSFVASARKAQVLKQSLVAAGADAQAVAAIVAPAGYPIAATTPEEIALSVLAAVVSHRRGATAQIGRVAQVAQVAQVGQVGQVAQAAQVAEVAPTGAVPAGGVAYPAAPAHEPVAPAHEPVALAHEPLALAHEPGAPCCGGPAAESPQLPAPKSSCCGN